MKYGSFGLTNKNANIFDTVFVMLTFFLMFFPSTSSWIRLSLLLIAALVGLYSNSFTICGGGWFHILFFVAVNFFSFILGMANGDLMSAIKYQTVDVLWPILFLFVAQPFKDECKWRFLLRTLVRCEFIVASFDVLSIAGSFLGVSYGGLINKIQAIQHYAYGDLGNFFQYFTRCQTTHIFMFPFLVMLSMSEQQYVKKLFLWITMGLSTICFLFSGRVAFIISALFSIIGSVALKRIFVKGEKHSLNKGIIRWGVVIIAIIAVFFFMNLISLRFGNIIDYIKYKFTTSKMTDHANGVRYFQNYSLIEGWKESPIFGHGTGTFSKNMGGYIWSQRGYESTYHVILFQKGIIGIINHIILYGWIGVTLFTSCKKKLLDISFGVPMIAGLSSILIASYADPYIFTMGSMWMIFYPFAIANYASLRKKE